MTATRLAAVTAPIAKLEVPDRLKVKAINGGWKPNIRPTPKLLENSAPNRRRGDAGRGGAGIALNAKTRSFDRLDDCALIATTRSAPAVPLAQITCVSVNAMLRIGLADHKGIADERMR